MVAIALGALGILVTLWWLGEDVRSVATIPVWALVLGASLTLVNYACGALRLTLLTRLAGQPVGFPRALRAYALGLFSAAITPGGSGQAPAVVLALMRDGLPASRAWSVNVHVWMVDLFFLAWSVPIGLAALSSSTEVLGGTSPLLLGIALSAFCLGLYAALRFRLTWLRAVIGPVMRLRFLRHWREGTLAFLERVAEATRELSHTSLLAQLALHALTAGLYVATYLTFYVIAVGLGAHGRLLPTLASVQLPMVVSFAFPTPGGSGLLEVFAASIFKAEGRGGAVGAAILGWRLLTFYSRFIVGPALGGTALLRQRPQEAAPGA